MMIGVADDSVVFDRAAGWYDRTRGLPPSTASAQTRLLAGTLAGTAAPVLEVGVGTGRIAIPLAEAGFRVVGVDLSAPMLAVLASKKSRVTAIRGSALALPVADQSVGAAICCHVLHLIPDWAAAVAEIQRVLRPGGLLLAARGGRPAGIGAELQREIETAAGLTPGGTAVGLDDLAVLDEHLAARGAAVRHLPEIDSGATWPASDFLKAAARNTYSWTWSIEESRLAAAIDHARDWLTRTKGDPAEVRMSAAPIRWHTYRLGA
jgi:SAM-dependent methyltransferase